MFAFCLFCETQRCKTIAEYINRNYGYICISPQIIQRKWIKGVPREESHYSLPGYLFLYTEDAVLPHFGIDGIVRFLGNGPLAGQDLAFAEMLYRRDGIIGIVPLIAEGERCRINDPAWEDIHGTVIKMDRGRKRCCVEYEFDNVKRAIWVGYEIIVKDNNI